MTGQGRGGEFPDLRIVPAREILFHEEVDLIRVADLLDRIPAENVLKNPPIVASLESSDRLLLLDGANRVSALMILEIPHLLVQVERLDDPRLGISHWNHVIRDLETDTLVEKGNIFCIGVKSADRHIRAGDEVAVMHDNGLYAVGVAQMCGREMVEDLTHNLKIKSKTGCAVNDSI